LVRHARIAAAVAAELSMGLFPSPSVSDVVVSRLADGAEVLRMPAGNPTVPGEVLGQVRQQLDELTPQAFLDRWGLEEPA
jgi:hypothetical protein